MDKRIISLLALSLALLLTFCGCRGKQTENVGGNKAEHAGGKVQSATAAPHPDSLPKAPEYEIVRDDRSLTDANGDVAIEYYFDLVVLKGQADGIDSINKLLEEARDEFFVNELDMQDYLGGVYEGAVDSWYNTVTAEVTYNENDLFSLKYNFAWYMGGISNEWSGGAVFDVNTGERAAMEKLVDLDKGTLEEKIRMIVVDAANENCGEEFYTYSDAAEYSLEEFGFYITEGQIVLIIPPYMLDAMSDGYEIETGIYIKTDKN
jgi:hypothetical protein